MNKFTDKYKIKKAISIVHKAGICARGSFVIGMDGETKETIRETIEFAKELKGVGLSQAAFHCLDLYPNTEFWKMVERGESTLIRNFDDVYDWSVLSRENPSMRTKDLSTEEIIQFKKECDAIFEK